MAARDFFYPARMPALAETALITLTTNETDPRARGLAAGSALAEPAARSRYKSHSASQLASHDDILHTVYR